MKVHSNERRCKWTKLKIGEDGWKHMKMLVDGIEYRIRRTEVNVRRADVADGGGMLERLGVKGEYIPPLAVNVLVHQLRK